MIKIVVGMLLITFDYVISPDGRIKLDLLPDFIGYAIMAYAFFKMYKNYFERKELTNDSKGKSKKHKGKNYTGSKAESILEINRKNTEAAIKAAVKKGIIVSAVMFIMSYISYMLDMYGVLSDMHDITSIVISIFMDMGMVVMVYILIQALSALQGQNSCFQIKRMTLLWKVMIVCIVCEYISLPIDMVALTFIIFEKVTEVIFMVYIFAANKTYKSRFCVKG